MRALRLISAIGFLCFLAAVGQAATSQATLDQDLSILQAKVSAEDVAISKIKVDQAFLEVGVTSGTLTNPVTLPINFIPGPKPIVALQGTIVVGSSITINSVSSGPAAIASGKSVSSAGNNFIVFGLNQTTIGEGVVANLSLTLSPVLAKNLYTVTLTNPVATDASGNTVLMNTISGTIRMGL